MTSKHKHFNLIQAYLEDDSIVIQRVREGNYHPKVSIEDVMGHPEWSFRIKPDDFTDAMSYSLIPAEHIAEDADPIDTVRRVINEQRPRSHPWFDVGKTNSDLRDFFKEYDSETDLVTVSFDRDDLSGPISIFPRSYFDDSVLAG